MMTKLQQCLQVNFCGHPNKSQLEDCSCVPWWKTSAGGKLVANWRHWPYLSYPMPDQEKVRRNKQWSENWYEIKVNSWQIGGTDLIYPIPNWRKFKLETVWNQSKLVANWRHWPCLTIEQLCDKWRRWPRNVIFTNTLICIIITIII